MRRSSRYPLALAFAGALAACASNATPTASTPAPVESSTSLSAPGARPADAVAMAEALLRHELGTPGTYLHGNRRIPLYVLVSVSEKESIDLPAAAIAALSGFGAVLHPGSEWTPPTGVGGTQMQLGIGVARPRADGDFDVTYGCYCGMRCGSLNSAVMRRGADGWQVLSSRMDIIS